MAYAKKASMKIEKREPKEPKGSEISRNKPTMHDGNTPTYHAHMTGNIHPKHDKPHILKNLKGC